MSETAMGDLEPHQRRRLIAASLLRSLLIAAVLVALYYIAPVDGEWRLSSVLRVVVGSIVFVVVVVWEIRRIISSEFPGIRADRGVGCNRPALPGPVRLDVLHDVHVRDRELQPRRSLAHGRLVLHGDGLLYRWIRRYQPDERERSSGGVGPDDPGPVHPRVRDQRDRQRGQDRPEAAVQVRLHLTQDVTVASHA